MKGHSLVTDDVPWRTDLASGEDRGSARKGAVHGRANRLRYAFVASALSKTLALGVQLLALPLALSALGTDRYAAFLALKASLGWVGLVGLGLVPSLPYFISSAHAAGKPNEERNIIGSVSLFMAGAGFILFTFLLITAALIPPGKIIAASPNISASELTSAYRIMAALAALQVVAGIMPSIRSGYQELHYSYIWTALANVAIICLLVFLPERKLAIWGFFLLLYSPLTASMLLDSFLLVWQRRYLVRALPQIGNTVRTLAPHAWNVMAVQVSGFLLAYLPLVIVSHLTESGSTAAYGSVMQPLVVGASGMNLIIQPLVPAIANARAHGDEVWIRGTYLRSLAIVLGICFAAALILTAIGPTLFHLWLRQPLGISRAMCAVFGLFFLFWMSSSFHFNLLNGMGELRGIGPIYLIEGALAIAFGTALTSQFGAVGMVAGLTLAMICVSAWYLPIRMRRALRAKSDPTLVK